MGLLNPSGIDWEQLKWNDEMFSKLDGLLKPLFQDENNHEYEVTDYFSPPEEGDEATCDFCNFTCHCLDKPEMLQHLLDEHIQKIEVPKIA